MKLITEAEYQALRAGPAIVTPEDAHAAAKALVQRCEAAGLIVTIARAPLVPLAMGHAETVVDVRPARAVA